MRGAGVLPRGAMLPRSRLMDLPLPRYCTLSSGMYKTFHYIIMPGELPLSRRRRGNSRSSILRYCRNRTTAPPKDPLSASMLLQHKLIQLRAITCGLMLLQ